MSEQGQKGLVIIMAFFHDEEASAARESARLRGEQILSAPFIRHAKRWLWPLCRAVLMCGLSFVILYPFLYMISMSFRPLNQMADPSVVWIPKSLTLDNLKRAIEYLDFRTTAVNTALITLCSTVLQIASASLAGYGMSRFRFKGRNVLFALLIASIIMPPQNIIIPLYRQFQNFDFFWLGRLAAPFNGGQAFTVSLIDHPLSMILPAMFANGIRSGLVIYIFMQFFKGMPKELEDAACVDGCGSFGTFARIIMPNMKPAVVTVFVFSMVWYWTDYFYAAMLNPQTSLSAALSGIGTQIAYDTKTSNPLEIQAVTQAGCLLFILPLLIVYLFLQKLFVQSIERTGITG